MVGIIPRFVAACALLSSMAIAANSDFALDIHVNLTQKASVGCTAGDNLTLTFNLDVGSDDVQDVYLVNPEDNTDNTISTFDSASGYITGNGTAASPYFFSVTAELNAAGDEITNVTAESLVTKAVINGNDTLTVHVMAKYNDPFSSKGQMIFPNDVLYKVSCNVSNVQDIIVSTGQIKATGTIDELPQEITETVELSVFKGARPVNYVSVGEAISLSLLHVNSSSSYATGFYAHTCSVCTTPDCSNLAFQFIDKKGCSSTNYISAFKPSYPLLETEQFNAFRFQSVETLYLQCYVNFCYTENAPRCIDFCGSHLKRIRRDVSDPQQEDIQVSAVLRVSVGDDDQIVIDQIDPATESELASKQAAAEKQQDLQNTVLLGTVVALAALLLIGLAAAILIFYRLSSKAKSQI